MPQVRRERRPPSFPARTPCVRGQTGQPRQLPPPTSVAVQNAARQRAQLLPRAGLLQASLPAPKLVWSCFGVAKVQAAGLVFLSACTAALPDLLRAALSIMVVVVVVMVVVAEMVAAMVAVVAVLLMRNEDDDMAP